MDKALLPGVMLTVQAPLQTPPGPLSTICDGWEEYNVHTWAYSEHRWGQECLVCDLFVRDLEIHVLGLQKAYAQAVSARLKLMVQEVFNPNTLATQVVGG